MVRACRWLAAALGLAACGDGSTASSDATDDDDGEAPTSASAAAGDADSDGAGPGSSAGDDDDVADDATTADSEAESGSTTGALPDERPLEGFGADTPGGAGGEVVVVTSLADAGPGTLRDALLGSNRIVEFDVGGTIAIESTIDVDGSFITVDGATAPAPGITVTAASADVAGALVVVRGHDIVLRHLRAREASDPETGDAFRIYAGYAIVVDHCSFTDGADGALDISNDAHDITVQWSIIGRTVKNQLIRTNVVGVSLHHNLYVHGDERNPQLTENAGVVDMVNNVIYDWASNYGTRITTGASANLVKNVYTPGPRSDEGDALVVAADAGLVYTEDNAIPAGNDLGTTNERLPAPPVTELAPDDALAAVLAEAGAFPRDDIDAALVADVVAGR